MAHDSAFDIDFANARCRERKAVYGDEVLLLHMDGSDTSTTFTDSSIKARTITPNGNVQIDTAQSKFGGASALFDGTSDYLSIASTADFNFGLGDFTVDFWIRWNSVTDTVLISDSGLNVSSFYLEYITTGTPRLALSSAFDTIVIQPAWSPSTSTWYHVAITRSGGTFRIFFDGVLAGASFSSEVFTDYTGNVTIGCRGDNTGPLNGWLDEVRFIRGQALWTQSFAVPTSAYTRLAQYPIALLLHMDGTDGAVTFPDHAGRHQVVANGNVQVDTAQSKFGGASCLFDGTGDYLSLDGSNDFIFGSGDFTVDFWFRANNVALLSVLFDTRPDNTQGAYPAIYFDSANIFYYVNTANRITGTTTLLTGTWYHVALVRQAGSTKLFLNGVQEGSTYTDSNNYLCAPGRPFIGNSSYDHDGGFDLDGWIEEFRVIKHYAAWSSAFTPPASAYSMNWQRETNQVLLCHFNGPDGSTSFSDATGRHLLTANGNVQIDDAQFKFGNSSALFDGTGDYLTLDGNSDFALGTGDFTVDFWARLNTAGATQTFIDFRGAGVGSSTAFAIYVFTDNILYFDVNAGGPEISGTTALTTGQWYHIAVTRQSGTTRMFLNGVQEGSNYTDANDYVIASSRPIIGSYFDVGNYLNGWMDGLRILKGIAAWVGDFAPPWVPHRAGESIPANAITTSRASVGYHRNGGGVLYKFGNNEPRITDAGLLVEDARTNAQPRSQEFGNAYWTASGVTVTSDTAAAPDGTTTAEKSTPNTSNGPHFIHNNSNQTALTNGEPYTISIYAKDAGYAYCSFGFVSSVQYQIKFQLLPGGGARFVESREGNIAASASGFEALANGWTRLWFVVSSAAISGGLAQTEIRVWPDGTSSDWDNTGVGDGTSGCYFWGLQIENASFPSSYIPTTTAAATRAQDAISTAGNAKLLEATTMSAVFGFQAAPNSAGQGLRVIGATNSNEIYENADADFATALVWGALTKATAGSGDVYSVNAKLGIAQNPNGASIVFNGGTVQTGSAPGTIAGATILTEAGGGVSMGGTARRLTLWNYKLPDATLDSLTS